MRKSHLFSEYCRRPDVMAELGADFLTLDEEQDETSRHDKRRRA
jgi:hypothetical protein